jgi:hypothetical protein
MSAPGIGSATASQRGGADGTHVGQGAGGRLVDAVEQQDHVVGARRVRFDHVLAQLQPTHR